MALLFLDTCHGYPNVEAATAGLYINTQNGRSPLPLAVTGRFPGTAPIIQPSFSSNSYLVGFKIKPTTTVVRTAIDFRRFTTAIADIGVYALTGFAIASSGAGGLPVAFSARTDVFYALLQRPTGEFALYKDGRLLATTTTQFSSLIDYYRLETFADLTVQGGFKLWVNDVLEIDYSGNLVGNTVGNVEAVVFGGPSQTSNGDVRYSTWAVWDDVGTTGFTGFLGDFQPVRLLPSAAGSVTQGTVTGATSNYLAVDDLFRNGNTDYVTLATNGAKDLYAYTDLTTTGPILSVVAQPSASLGGTGMARVRAEVKSGDTTQQSAPSRFLQTLTNVYGPVDTFEFPVDPATGAAWTIAAVNAAEFGVSAVL